MLVYVIVLRKINIYLWKLNSKKCSDSIRRKSAFNFAVILFTSIPLMTTCNCGISMLLAFFPKINIDLSVYFSNFLIQVQDINKFEFLLDVLKF